MGHSKSVLVWLGLALSTLGGGCKSADDAPAPVPLEQFPQTFAKGLCDAVAPCCNQAALPYMATECQGSATDRYTDTVSRAISAHVQYDAEAAGECLASLRRQLQDCRFDGGESIPACAAVFVGSLADGQACTASAECKSLYCNQLAVCAARPGADTSKHAQAGEPCVGSCGTEAGQTYCDTGISTGQGSGANAGYCYQSDGVYCDAAFSPDGAPMAPVCSAFAKIGESCQSAYCGPGSYCDFTSITCAAQKDSGPCASPQTCSSKSYCAGAQGGGVTGQCIARKPDGFACASPEECSSGSCSGGTTDHRTCGTSSGVSASECNGDF